MTRDSALGWASARMLRDQLLSSWRWGLLIILFVGLSVLAGRWLLTTVTTETHRASGERFTFGQDNLRRQQRQLQQAVTQALQSMGFSTHHYLYDRIRSQHQGQASWTLWRHHITVPTTDSLTDTESRLRQVLKQFPHTVLARRTRERQLTTTVALTTGVEGQSTDIFVLTQPQLATPVPSSRPSLTSPNVTSALPALAQIAIVIDDMGWDLTMAKALLALDAPLSFAIIPQSSYQSETVKAVQQHGRDILLHLPMEPHGYPQVNPGKYALLSTMSPQELTTQLQAALQLLPMAVGVNNHMGSQLTENPQAMRVVMRELQQRNLFFLDSRTSSQSTAYAIAREIGIRAGRRQVFLDHDTQPKQIARQLQQLMALAHKHGQAIGIGHPYPETLNALQHLLPELRQAGIAIVPVSDLIH